MTVGTDGARAEQRTPEVVRERRTHALACLPGDGIGGEVTAEARRVLEVAGARYGFSLDWLDLPFGAAHYRACGEIFPEAALRELKSCRALLLGAIGDPSVPPGILERGILLRLRCDFDMYVNLRPARSYPRVPLPVALEKGKGLDALVVRENTEDFYVGIGGRLRDGALALDTLLERGTYTLRGSGSWALTPPGAGAVQLGVATEGGVRRVTAFACEAAQKRGEERVTLVSKANAMPQLYGFWEEMARDEARRWNTPLEVVNVDALCYHLVRNPGRYGTLLCPNMFGDIVSDLLAALAGGLGLAAGANLGRGLGMFEPVHGSAPDIAGRGEANPLAAMLSGGMLLASVGEEQAAAAVDRAVERYLETASPKELPRELGGEASTRQVGEAVVAQL